jgi:hypothetical protein
MKECTSSSLTRETVQPPHPAPINRAPIAPLRRQSPTKLSSSGQLKEHNEVPHTSEKNKKFTNGVWYGEVNKVQRRFKILQRKIDKPAFIQKAAAGVALIHKLP